jgi:hypothetical protein
MNPVGRIQETVYLGRQEMTEASLYERLGGAFAIAAVVDHFSDAVCGTRSRDRGRRIPN